MEVIVVLVLLGLAAALAAPAFIVPEPDDPSALSSIVSGVRELAARRGETLKLRLTPDGEWRVEAAQGSPEGVLAEGRLEGDFRGPAFTLMVSPLGTCGFEVRSSAASRFIRIDPLTCEVGLP